MGKGLCSENHSWLAKITDVGEKIVNIMGKVKDAVNKMFTDKTIKSNLNITQKEVNFIQ